MNMHSRIQQGPIGATRRAEPIGDVWEGVHLTKKDREKKRRQREEGRPGGKQGGVEFRKGFDPRTEEKQPHGIWDLPEFADHEVGRIIRLNKEGWVMSAIADEYETTPQAIVALLRSIKASIRA